MHTEKDLESIDEIKNRKDRYFYVIFDKPRGFQMMRTRPWVFKTKAQALKTMRRYVQYCNYEVVEYGYTYFRRKDGRLVTKKVESDYDW